VRLRRVATRGGVLRKRLGSVVAAPDAIPGDIQNVPFSRPSRIARVALKRPYNRAMSSSRWKISSLGSSPASFKNSCSWVRISRGFFWATQSAYYGTAHSQNIGSSIYVRRNFSTSLAWFSMCSASPCTQTSWISQPETITFAWITVVRRLDE
jgi:hypothetical protein